MNTLEEIRCEIIPIPTSSPDHPPKHALFFHRIHEQGTKSAIGTDETCYFSPNRNVVAVQCIYCTKSGSQVKRCDDQSNKCIHCSIKNSFKLVSWFDERIEVVLPPGRNWLNRVGSSDIFVPLADHVGFSFKLVRPSIDNSEITLFANDVIVADLTTQRRNLSRRCLVPVAELKKFEELGTTKKISRIGSFSVLTYNILSDIYLYPERRIYCPQWALTWEYRRRNLLHEIILYEADVICLQEVQSDHFENYFKPELARYGYSVVYKKKTNEVYTGNGYTSDGCATFFRSDMFKEVIAYELEFSRTAWSLIGKLEQSQRDQARVRFIKDNIALAVILEFVGDSTSHATPWSRLCVVNTHIYASMGFPDVKLLQVSDLVSEIEKMIDPRMPLFICGDINSIPGSEPYNLLARGCVNREGGLETIDPLGIHRYIKLHHSMKLANAYASASGEPVNDLNGQRLTIMECSAREPSLTTLTPNRGRTLDYIFYTVDSLEVNCLLELLGVDSVGRALPSPLWSSDHVALMANFRIKKPFLD